MDNLETAEPKSASTEPLNFERLSEAEQLQRSLAFYEAIRKRRTVREFSSDPVPYQLIENAIAGLSCPLRRTERNV